MRRVAKQPSGIRRKRKILLIDEDDGTRLLLGDYFESIGYQVETTADANEGISRALRLRPNVIILDLPMRGLSGWHAISLLRTYPTTAAIPVVVYTAVRDLVDVIRERRGAATMSSEQHDALARTFVDPLADPAHHEVLVYRIERRSRLVENQNG